MTEQQEANLLSFIINRQFELIGEQITYEDLPDDGVITIGKKKIRWYEHYLFRDEDQYLAWKAFAISELTPHNLQKKFDLIDMTYGLDYKRSLGVVANKKGQIEMF